MSIERWSLSRKLVAAVWIALFLMLGVYVQQNTSLEPKWEPLSPVELMQVPNSPTAGHYTEASVHPRNEMAVSLAASGSTALYLLLCFIVWSIDEFKKELQHL